MFEGSLIVYIVLYLLLIAIFSLVGWNISKGAKYWQSSIWAIVAFTFVSGSRFLRGNDYVHYMDVYNYDLENKQVVFTWFNHVLKDIGVSPYFIFYFYAFVFVVCLMAFLRPFRKYAYLMFPMALIATINFEEYQIRQAFGYSLVFLFAYELMFAKDNRYKKIALCSILFLLSYGIHSANIILFVLICFFYFIYRRPIPLIISVPLYIIASYVISTMLDLSFLQPFVDLIGDSDTKFSGYAENADYWFGSEGYKDIYTRNVYVQFFETLGNISLMYLGIKEIKTEKNNIWLPVTYNLFIVGTLIQKAFRNLELLNRIGGDIMIFWFVPFVFVVADRKNLNPKKKIFISCCYICLTWWFYSIIRFIFTPEEKFLFLWDMV